MIWKVYQVPSLTNPWCFPHCNQCTHNTTFLSSFVKWKISHFIFKIHLLQWVIQMWMISTKMMHLMQKKVKKIFFCISCFIFSPVGPWQVFSHHLVIYGLGRTGLPYIDLFYDLGKLILGKAKLCYLVFCCQNCSGLLWKKNCSSDGEIFWDH